MSLMAEVSLKRQREEEGVTEEAFKRQKSYEDILCILEDDDEEPISDLSFLITTLQQEISSNPQMSSSSEADLSVEDESELLMKHLLEASDDELGIPNAEVADQFGGAQGLEIDGGDLLLQPAADGFVGDGLWEIEDEAANYYALLQSELFM